MIPAGLLAFAKNIAGTALSTFGSLGATWLNNKWNNSHLTGKEQEQNAFNAQQAELNRDFQQQMSNTANQRAVADMQSAGLNPALMYGNGSAASTPTGSNAQGSASLVSSPSFQDAVAAYATLKQVNADVDLKKSEASLNRAKEQESQVNAGLIVQQTQNAIETHNEIVARVRGMELDNDQKEIILSYEDERQRLQLDNLRLDLDAKQAQVDKFNAEIHKLSEETKKVAQETINLQEQVRLMLTQENLNNAQAGQCAAMIRQIDENVKILEKDNSHYDWNHIKTLSFKDGVAVVPTSDGEYKGSFTGSSAAIRPKGSKRGK